MALVDELRENYGSGLVRLRFPLHIFELLTQRLRLELELLGHLLPHRCRHSIFDDLGGTIPPLRPNLQQIRGDALLS